MGRYTNCTYFYTLYDAVNDLFPAVSREEACTILRETILAPDDYVVEFNNATYTQQQLFIKIAQQLIENSVNETPQKTFYNTLERVAEIIKHMNDGYVSKQDHKERTDFLKDISRQEFMLFSALAFRHAAHSDNEKSFDELILNIIRLREINDLVVDYTRDEEEIEVDRTEFEQAKLIYRMLKSLQNLGYEYNFSPRERTSLGIDHEQDSDLTELFNYNNWLKRLMLLELRKEVSIDDELFADDRKEGKQNDITAEDDLINDRIAQLRGTISKRKFDMNRFRMLEKSQDENVVNGEPK